MAIVYNTTNKVEYVFTVDEIKEYDNFTCVCTKMKHEDKIYYLHNEISFTFKITNNKIVVLNGWHIGTEDFTFSVEEGDNCEGYIEEYNPGLLNQLKTYLLNNNLIKCA